MMLDDKHVNYLKMVKDGRVALRNGKYYGYVNPFNGRGHVEQAVAISVEYLGLTHITPEGVRLTSRGEWVLAEEEEAWGE